MAWLEGALIVNDMRARMGGDDSGHFYRAAIALLDEARKDRERLDWIDGAFWCDYARSAVGVAEITAGTLVTHLAIGEGDTVRAAIDQARGA